MRKRIIFLCLVPVLLLHQGFAQSITRYEYFFDADPGLGRGISFAVPAADSIAIDLPVNLTGLSAGLHVVGIRAMSNNGTWGHAEFRHLLISALVVPSQSPLVKAEYFFNTDPGVGSAIPFTFPVADSTTTNFALDISALAAGTHVVGFRFQDQNSKWGHTEFRYVFIQPLPDAAGQKIVAGEFYFGDNVPQSGNGIPFTIQQAGDSVSVEVSDTLDNLAPGEHKVHIRFRNANGIWSHQESRLFTVCTDYGPVSDHIYKVEGNKVFFTNQSSYADTLLWKFGDNTSDTVANPVKTYASAGMKNVELITKNHCGSDTLLTSIEIRGLQKVSPGRTGNAGISTIQFEGFGFTASTEVKLVFGSQSLTPIVKTMVNSNRIEALFDCNGFTPGLYHAVAVLGSTFDTLKNAVSIENAVPSFLTLQNSGKKIFRLGHGKLISTLQNHGSHDAVMVPYIGLLNIKEGESANRDFIPVNDMVFLPGKGIFAHTLQYLSSHNVSQEVMAASMLDSARGRNMVAYYKVKIPGYSSTTELARNRNTITYGYQAGSLVMPELLDSYAMLGIINSDYRSCYNTFLKHEVEKQLNIKIGQNGWDNCFNNAFDTLMKTLTGIVRDPALQKFGVPMQAGFSALLASMADCPSSGIPSGLGGLSFKRIIQGVMNNWIFQEDVDSLHADCIDTTVQFAEGRVRGSLAANLPIANSRVTGDCADCPGAKVFPEMCETCGPILAAMSRGKKNKVLKRAFGFNSATTGCQEWCESTSIDPNSKFGPGNNNDRKYINHLEDIAYTINFENLASATAPAAFVEIRDTIDKSKFDISTLQPVVIAWGDSVVTVEPNRQDHSLLKDLRPHHPNFLRIDIVTDTAVGVIRWRFWTLDTVTLQLTDEVTEGFLPPNTNGIDGEGYVTFTVRPYNSLAPGTIVRNKATIIFDENLPIITPEWEHRIDTVRPASRVANLPANSQTARFAVSWSGSDAHAGVDKYSVYVSVNDSSYKLWHSMTGATTDTFAGQFGNTYKFISIALDRAGNFEEPPLNALGSPDAVTTIQNPLSLTLLDFEARALTNQRKTELTWTATYEVDVSHFEIQRSVNALQFMTIGRVDAKNVPAVSIYHWTDEKSLSGINYYRLKIVNLDGTIEYSAIRWVQFNGPSDPLLVFPTITDRFVYVQGGINTTIELFNVQGKRLMRKPFSGNIQIDLSPYPAGAYFIRSVKDNQVYKIIKY